MSTSLRPQETAALVDALGDFLLFMQREKQVRRGKSHRKAVATDADAEADAAARDRKRRVLTWLRAMSEIEWASLHTVVDAGFVKTVLAMGMAARTAEAERARRRRACSVSRVTSGVTEFQLIPRDDAVAKRAFVATAPREFLRRPVMRTHDGDTLMGFQSQSFIDACGALVQGIYMVNSTRSCDTLSVVASDGSTRAEWLNRMDTISGGQFLLQCPSDQQPMWGQTAWFASRAYFTLPELIVNQIEMNVWFHWSQAQKSSAYRIPVQGIAAKHLFAAEWGICSEVRRHEALARVASQVMAHLKQLAPPTTRAITRTTQLSMLSEILESWQMSHTKVTRSGSKAVVMFAQSLDRILASPQNAAVAFLVAELMQDECGKIVTESLLEPQLNDVDDQPKNTHAQRRRAARKKIAKQRKQETEHRLVHGRHLRAVCGDIPRTVKAWHARSVECVREVLASVVDSVVASAESPTNVFLLEDTATTSGSVFRTRRKKKRGKKKSSNAKISIEIGDHFESDAPVSNTKENQYPNGNTDSQLLVRDGEKFKAARNDPEQSMILRPDNARPLLSFFASTDDHSYTNSRTSTFGTHPFYTMTSPLYLQLSSNRDASSTHKPEAGDLGDEEADGSAMHGHSAGMEPNFDWYLPSLFSSQSSVHTSSTVSSLDWDFQRWNVKNDNQSRTSATAKSSKLRPLLKTPIESVSPVGSIASPVSPALGEDGSSTDSNFALNGFTNIVDTSDEASVKSDALEGEAAMVAVTLAEDKSDERSDFLYREGGFFDRQRGPKRRRRPFPFEYDDDIADDCCSADGVASERPWGPRLSNASERGRPSVRSDASTNNSTSCACRGRGGDEDERSSRENALLAERIYKLERLLEECTMQTVTKESSSLSAELSGLQQQVAILSERVVSLESEVEEVRRTHKNVNDEESLPPPPPLSIQELQQPPPDQAHSFPVPLVSSAQSYPHPIMRPGGASNYSLLGPFVSVPMSVLPPRSKLHWDMCEFVSQLQNDSNARLSAQMAAIRFCTSAVQSLWPRAQVRPYGSFVTRLALPTSDVDLVICLPKVRRDAPADAAGVLEGRNAIKESWQQNLARKLRQEPWVVSDSVKTIPHAAIPIISLITTLPFNVRLDISFEGPGHNGLATNDVVLSLMHEFPPLAPIMLVLKSFVIERGFAVAYSGGLSSYALLLMVARYLQEHTDRYENHATASTASSSSADFGMVLMGLLDFYGNRFEPRTTGISVAARCFFNRDSIVPTHQHGYAPTSVMYSVDDAQDHWQHGNHSHLHSANLLSSPGSRRHNNRTSMNDGPTQRANGMPDSSAAHDPHKFDPLFIEDPLYPSNNVGRNCFRITQIRRAFAAGYEILMAASMSTLVFSENRTPAIGGVALHPENILRAILGASSPAFTSAAHNKNDTGAVAVAVPPSFQPPKPRGRARYAPPIMPLYDQQHAQAPFAGGVQYYNGNAGGPVATPPPYMLQRTQPQYHQQAQYQHRHANIKSQQRLADSGGNYRRHSGSVTEHMTTRSEAASSAAKFSVKRGKGADRSLTRSPRLIPPAMHRSSSIELDKMGGTNGGNSVDSNGAGRGRTTRKCPSRSMSFADVVMSGGGAATVENQRKAPSSPLALARSGRRHDAALDEPIVERLETKDDFELK